MMLRLTSMALLACCFLIGLPNESSAADMVVRVQSGSINTADASQDFYVWLDNNTGSSISFATFSLKLILEPLGSNALSFATDANQANLYSNPSDYANYVFSGNSLNKDILDGDPTAYPWVISTSVSSDDSYSVSDITADTADAIIPDGSSLLLAIVRVLPGSAQAGDLFGLNVVTGGETSFTKEDFSDVPFSTTDGVITVVPEPSAYLMGCTAALAIGFVAKRRKSGASA